MAVEPKPQKNSEHFVLVPPIVPPGGLAMCLTKTVERGKMNIKTTPSSMDIINAEKTAKKTYNNDAANAFGKFVNGYKNNGTNNNQKNLKGLLCIDPIVIE